MRKALFALVFLGFISGCSHSSLKPKGGFMLFRKLRNPDNKEASPPTPLPNNLQPPLGFVPPGMIIPGSNHPMSPGVQGTISGPQVSISQKPVVGINNQINLLQPQPANSNGTGNIKAKTNEPPQAKEEIFTKEKPLDIPGFGVVTGKITTGLLPFPDGIDWLKAKGIQTVIFLHEQGAETKAIELLFQKRGLNLSLQPLDEKKLTKSNFPLLFSSMEKAGDSPVFVFDLDGNLSTAYWHVFFRHKKELTEIETLKELERLGLNPNRSIKSKTLVQQIEIELKK